LEVHTTERRDAVALESLDALDWLRKHLEQDSPDLVREMLKSFAEQLMSAEADALCGAGDGERKSRSSRVAIFAKRGLHLLPSPQGWVPHSTPLVPQLHHDLRGCLGRSVGGMTSAGTVG
jgi:hypothetical protein